MTDRELLLANNEKIKEIQETLKNKILALDGTELIVELPEMFQTEPSLSIVYYFQVDDNTLLASANLPNNIGIWQYKIKEQTWTQLWEYGRDWQYFQEVPNGILISASSSYSELTQGVVFYDKTTETTTQLYNKSSSWRNYQQVSETKWLISSTTTNTGVLLYNSINNTIERKYTSGSSFRFFENGDNYLIIGYGLILLYNATDDSVTSIYSPDIKSGYEYVYKIEDGYLFSGSSSDVGILRYKTSDNSVIQVYTEGKYWQYFKEVGDYVLISSSDTNSGMLSFNKLTDETTKIYDTNHSWMYFQLVPNGCLVSNNITGSGLWLFNPTTNSMTKIYETGGVWIYYQLMEDRCLISSGATASASRGILVYYFADNSVVQKYTEGYAWKYFKIVNNTCFISSSSTNGLVLYNYSTDTFNSIYKYSNSYNIFTPDGDNYYIESSNKTTNPKILYYNATDQTCKLVKYYIGEIK